MEPWKFKHASARAVRDPESWFSSAATTSAATAADTTAATTAAAATSTASTGITATQQAYLGAAGKLISTVGTGMAAGRNAESQEQAAKFNQNIDLQDASMTAAQTASNEANLRMSQAQEVGALKTKQADSGFAGGGSQDDVVQQNEVDNEMQALTQRYTGTVQRYNYLNNANLEGYYGKVAKGNASAAITNTAGGALASMLELNGNLQKYATPTGKASAVVSPLAPGPQLGAGTYNYKSPTLGAGF